MTRMLRDQVRVYVLIDPDWCAGRDPVAVAEAALAGGATALQLRWKGASDRERVALGRKLAALGHDHLFVMNDRVDLALACGAGGVHLGPDDLAPDVARQIAPELVIGASCRSPEMIRAAQGAGADYVGVGAVFDAQAVKANASEPRGTRWLAEMVRVAESTPVVAIGGITIERAGDVVATGVSGIAVTRAVSAAPDVAAAARALRAAF